jgi:alpha-L-arabinofuranosidase
MHVGLEVFQTADFARHADGVRMANIAQMINVPKP